MSKYKFICGKVSNRGSLSDDFLDEMIAWAKSATDVIFEPNNNNADIYACMGEYLRPWPDITHRKAAMLEALRVLALFESSGNWNEGRDATAGAETPQEMEAGAWQVSADGRVFGADLEALYTTLVNDCPILSETSYADSQAYAFQSAMKSNHPAAIQWISRLLRWTTKANGPTLNKTGSNSIYAWLSRDAQAEFVTLLQG